ncbi:MAG TPA: branched-chain amino acid ABC transporter permease, partial [Acidimicrobiia bacterium]|nr:branched-chain amino acid ABC transporter permease [Acidimicrobiia bacterium]
MRSLVALAYNNDLLRPALVLGVAAAGLYGLLAVSLVLTYRVSRTIGFVQGGIALAGAYLYRFLTIGSEQTTTNERLGFVPALLITVAAGAAVGAVYGAIVTGKRMANYPRIVVTMFSLATLLLLAGFSTTLIPADEGRVPSAFGTGVVKVFGGVATVHQVATVAILLALVGLLTVALRCTRTGIFIRAIADDVDASRVVGIPLTRMGSGVYVFSGAIAGLAGALLASSVGTAMPNILFIFLRALIVAVLGGLTSLPLALAGCLLLGVAETMLTAGVFGLVANDQRELMVMGLIFGLVFVINRLRPIRV